MPILALPAEHEHEHEDRVKRGLVAMIIGGAVGDPNVSGAGGRAEPVRREKRQEKRWVWDSRIIQDGDTRTDLPPPGSNVNYFSNSDPASTPSGTPPPPSLSDPFPTTTTPGAAIKPARQSPPSPSPSTTTTTPAEEPHTTAKSRKMWNDPSLQGGKKAAHLVGAASPAPKVEPEAQTTSAEGGRSPRVKAAVAVAEQTPAAAAVEEIKVAAPVEEVEEHDPHKFARPSSSSPIPIPTPAAPDVAENQKRYYRGPILQDGVPTEEVPIQGGGAETPTSTPEVPSLTSVEVTGTGTASAEEAVQTQGGESVAEAEAFGQDLLEAIGLAVGEGEGEGEGESSANASEATPAPGVEKRAHHHHHQHARGLTRQGQGHSPRLGLGAAPGAPKMRVKRVYKAREGFEERRRGVKSSE
ncbi:hypothetical protein BCR35DRAFT_306354 [Leucosporidium creatinivorum]|uniref:Uncharacterized protein n=1 Tax=Leucosporidium creatinivorum TaxID=106004 RepID=A0A1Y2EUX2_9BASI|nr:hypothetical protein BCR35DRAFT_306354 [Leucosporidium creatinivorum]